MINKKTGLIALLASFAAGEMMAGNLTTYTPGSGDVLICFRKSADLVVDSVSLSTLTGYAANSVNPIAPTYYTASQLTTSGSVLTFGGLNAMYWSAFTWQNDNTLYMTQPRPATALNVQSLPPTPSSSDGQGLTINRLNKLIVGTKAEATYDSFSTTSAILTEDDSINNQNFGLGTSYHDAIIGANHVANFNNTYGALPEQKTAPNFTTAGKVQRSDFYQLTPGAASAVWLGYFELNTNGVLSYVAYPSTQPVIQSISHTGNQTTITYTTGLYGTYTLRQNSSLNSGTPQISWTSVATLASGDTASHSITFTDNNAIEDKIAGALKRAESA